MNFLKRVIVSVIFIPLLLWTYYHGGTYLLGLTGIFSVLAAYEMRQMWIRKKIDIMWTVIPLTLIGFLSVAVFSNVMSILMLLASMIIIGMSEVGFNRIDNAVIRLSASVFTIVYCGMTFGLLNRIRVLPHGEILLPALTVLIWITDTGAYFVGMTLGRHRGIFKASPKKSLEGFIGGLLFALLFAFLSTIWFKDAISLKTALLLALCAGLFGQFGDLFESVIKRDFGVKDSSNLIPGHGGILDRFDSLMIAAPVFYLLMIII